MKRILIVIVFLSAATWGQDAGVIPPPDIVGASQAIAQAPARAQAEASQIALIRQQTALLKQQTEAMREQNAFLQEQQRGALTAGQNPLSTNARKPQIDDVDPLTKRPKFAKYADYEDAKDEWLIEEALRRFEAVYLSNTTKP